MLSCRVRCRGVVAVCAECGEEMSIPGLIDKNVQEIDEQYRTAEGLVSIDDIERLMKIYKIGKAPLSLALGFGEVTIPRYLEGQVPSKEYGIQYFDDIYVVTGHTPTQEIKSNPRPGYIY